MIKNGYYYPVEMDKALTHLENGEIVGKAQVGISFGNRTAGKTVGHGIRLIDHFERAGEQAVLLAKTEKQRQAGYLEKWFRNKVLNVRDEEGVIEGFLDRHKISFTQDEMWVDSKVMCYCVPISMSHEAKDTFAGELVTTLLMDEATQGESSLVINGRSALERIMEIWQTAARGYKDAVRLCNIVYIANVSSIDSWLFNDYGLHSFVNEETKQTCQKGFFIDIVNNTAATEQLDTSIMSGIMRESNAIKEYYEAAQNNVYRDNKSFIVKRGLDFKSLKAQFEVDNVTVGIFDYGDKMHVSIISPDARSRLYIGDPMKLKEGAIYDDRSLCMALATLYKGGALTFQNIQSKGACLRYAGLYRD